MNDRQKERTLPAQRVAHPLLGLRIPHAVDTDAVYETVLSLSAHPWLADHCVGDDVTVPGTAVAELVRAAAEDCLGYAVELRALVFREPLLFRGGRALCVRVTITSGGNRALIHSHSADCAEMSLTLCAVARVSRLQSGERCGPADVDALRSRVRNTASVDSLYDDLAAAGLRYGPAFRGLRALACGTREAVGEIRLPVDLDSRGYGMHPALLDAALHVLAGLASKGACDTWIPFEIGRLAIYDTNMREAIVHVRFARLSVHMPVVDVIVMNAEGSVIAEMSSVALRRAAPLMRRMQVNSAGANFPSLVADH